MDRWKKMAIILPTGQWYAPSAVLNDAWYCMVLHGIAFYCMVLHSIAWYCMVLHGIAWYCRILQGIAWYCMVLHGIALYCIVSHGIAWNCMVLHGIKWHCMVHLPQWPEVISEPLRCIAILHFAHHNVLHGEFHNWRGQNHFQIKKDRNSYFAIVRCLKDGSKEVNVTHCAWL